MPKIKTYINDMTVGELYQKANNLVHKYGTEATVEFREDAGGKFVIVTAREIPNETV
jgi:hypothetical protein